MAAVESIMSCSRNKRFYATSNRIDKDAMHIEGKFVYWDAKHLCLVDPHGWSFPAVVRVVGGCYVTTSATVELPGRPYTHTTGRRNTGAAPGKRCGLLTWTI